jgi:hypothetical protein
MFQSVGTQATFDFEAIFNQNLGFTPWDDTILCFSQLFETVFQITTGITMVLTSGGCLAY